jgi:carboxypeptidase C (cathepsin A)
VAGYHKQVDNLHFLIILNSGHLVPMDQPRNALDLVSLGVHFQVASSVMPS